MKIEFHVYRINGSGDNFMENLYNNGICFDIVKLNFFLKIY
jgi:hypothetical protein